MVSLIFFCNYQIYLKVCLKTRFVINKDETSKVIENINKIKLISKINKWHSNNCKITFCIQF